MRLDRLRERAQSFSEDVAREGYLAFSGLKPDAALQQIYARYADILSDDVLAGCVARFEEAAAGSEDARATRMMLEWQIEARVARQLADLDEREVRLENEAVVRVADSWDIPYHRVSVDIANSTDAAERRAIDTARVRVVGDVFAPLRLERLQRERDAVESLGIAPDYIATFEAVSGVDVTALARECEAFLRDTESLWHSVLSERLRAFGIARGAATRADSLALFRLHDFDDAFPGSGLTDAVRRNCVEMGIDITASEHVQFDTVDRPGKRARAFCAPVRVPEEVYVVLRPHGGQADYRTFLHELGHALHFANARADYPFEYRWLGDNSVTEGFAMLFDHRMQQREWLQRYTVLERNRTGAFLRLIGFEELHFVRRYCAKLLYEMQLYGHAAEWRSLPDVYVQLLSSATGFNYQPADAFIDLDSRFYSARYLRAWQLQSSLEEGLVERFNEDWWRNPSAGPWIVGELFAEGQRETAGEVALRVAGLRLSFAPLIRKITSLLET